MNISDVPGLSSPVVRALAAEGWTTLADLDGQPRTTVLNLHGVGKVGLARLEEAMAAEGLALRDGHAVWTRTDPGPVTSTTQTTTVTDVDPRDFVESLPWPRRVEEGRELLHLFGEATGAEPRMWGPTMIGYGHMTYQYATGRTGETMRLGFSPRKAAISLYGLEFYGSGEAVRGLGKVRLGKSCVYVNKLGDIDLDELRAVVRRAWETDEFPEGSGC